MKKELLDLIKNNPDAVVGATNYDDDDFLGNLDWIQNLIGELTYDKFNYVLESDLIGSLIFGFECSVGFLILRNELVKQGKNIDELERKIKNLIVENQKLLNEKRESLVKCSSPAENKYGLSPEEVDYLVKMNENQEKEIKRLNEELDAANKKVSALTEERDCLNNQVVDLSELYDQVTEEDVALRSAEKSKLSNLRPRKIIDNTLNLKELRIAALRGDTLDKIANYYGVSTATFKKWLKEAGYENWREFKKVNGYDKTTLKKMLDFDF